MDDFPEDDSSKRNHKSIKLGDDYVKNAVQTGKSHSNFIISMGIFLLAACSPRAWGVEEPEVEEQAVQQMSLLKR